MAREIYDKELNVAGNCPNAANTVNTNAIDLGATTPYPVTETLTARFWIGTCTGANNKNINIRLMDSADNSSFANVAVVANPVLRSVDANGGGHAAETVDIQLPPTIRRYVRATALGEANGGDSSDGQFGLKILT